MLRLLRESGVLLSDGKHNFIIFLLAERIQEGKESTLDGLNWHERSNNGYLVDSVDTRSQVVGVQLLLKQLEGVNILHKI